MIFQAIYLTSHSQTETFKELMIPNRLLTAKKNATNLTKFREELREVDWTDTMDLIIPRMPTIIY